MICGALQTLNEEAFEDVVGNDRNAGCGVGPGETLGQQLAPIREGFELIVGVESQSMPSLNNFNNGASSSSHIGSLVTSNTSNNPSGDSLNIQELVAGPNNGFTNPGRSYLLNNSHPSTEGVVNSKDATVIVMSQFTQNIDDTPL